MNKKQILQEKVIQNILKNDDFITKIRYANSGALTMGNIMCFDYAISHLPSSSMVAQEVAKSDRYQLIKKCPHYFLQKLA